MSDSEAQAKASRFAELARALSALHGTSAADSGDLLSFWVPGRIEVLGKHTDYGGGRPSLPAQDPSLPAQDPSLPAQDPSLPAQDPSLPAQDPSLPARDPSSSSPALSHDYVIGANRPQMDSRFRGNDGGMGPRFPGDDGGMGSRFPGDDRTQHAHDETGAYGTTEADTSPQSLVRIVDANSGETCEFRLTADTPVRPGTWCNYPITVARRIAINFSGPMRGADIIFSSDLPHAAGVSSSSALVVAMFLALSAVNDLPQRPEYRENIRSPEDLGGYLGCVENGLDFKSLRGSAGVGTFGGSEDQTAILCSRSGAIVQYSFCPVRFERAIAMPRGYCFAIASSGVTAEKTGAALERYNRVSRRLSVGLDRWRDATDRDDISMGAAIASSPDAHNRIRESLRVAHSRDFSVDSMVERFDQFHAETNEIIPAAGDALARADLTTFGDLVAESQERAERALENQIPETIALVKQARALGAVAASAFGAGFGGSVWALVETSSTDRFLQGWSDAYSREFPVSAPGAQFFASRAGPAALSL